MLWQVTTPRASRKPFCAGLIVSNTTGRCIYTAPILKYMNSWYEEDIADFCRVKGWRFKPV